jgi:hypothetical protein
MLPLPDGVRRASALRHAVVTGAALLARVLRLVRTEAGGADQAGEEKVLRAAVDVDDRGTGEQDVELSAVAQPDDFADQSGSLAERVNSL